jgi:uncharacterized protein
VALPALAVLMALAALSAQAKNPDRIFQLKELQVVSLTVGKRKVKAWVMGTPSKRAEGMMFLRAREVPNLHGMLFVFSEPQPLSFWMRNTLIDLDIAYLDKSGKVLNTMVMKALNESGHPSKGNALYALEMVRGSFSKVGIRAGVKIGIPKSVRAKG